MVKPLFENVDSCAEDDAAASAVISPQPRGWVATFNHVSLDNGYGAFADRHRIHVGHQESSRSPQGAGEFDNQVATVSGERCFGVGLVEGYGFGRAAGSQQFFAYGFGDLFLLAGDAWNGQQVEHGLAGSLDRSG